MVHADPAPPQGHADERTKTRELKQHEFLKPYPALHASLFFNSLIVEMAKGGDSNTSTPFPEAWHGPRVSQRQRRCREDDHVVRHRRLSWPMQVSRFVLVLERPSFHLDLGLLGCSGTSVPIPVEVEGVPGLYGLGMDPEAKLSNLLLPKGR